MSLRKISQVHLSHGPLRKEILFRVLDAILLEHVQSPFLVSMGLILFISCLIPLFNKTNQFIQIGIG